jgi:choline dehydrogenase-like flavoprotein
MTPPSTNAFSAVWPTNGRRYSVIGYRAAHWRVKYERGLATEYRCMCCRERQAQGWALRHGGLDDLVEFVDGWERTYSLDADRYWPACQACHTRYDRRYPDPVSEHEIPVDLAELAEAVLVGQGATLGIAGGSRMF